MIDTKELRLIVQDYKLAGSPVFIQAADMDEILDRLEAAEKSDAESLAMYRRVRDERDNLRAALTALLNDLEERAPLNIEKSPRVVACGNSVYVQAKAALEATP